MRVESRGRDWVSGSAALTSRTLSSGDAGSPPSPQRLAPPQRRELYRLVFVCKRPPLQWRGGGREEEGHPPLRFAPSRPLLDAVPASSLLSPSASRLALSLLPPTKQQGASSTTPPTTSSWRWRKGGGKSGEALNGPARPPQGRRALEDATAAAAYARGCHHSCSMHSWVPQQP